MRARTRGHVGGAGKRRAGRRGGGGAGGRSGIGGRGVTVQGGGAGGHVGRRCAVGAADWVRTRGGFGSEISFGSGRTCWFGFPDILKAVICFASPSSEANVTKRQSENQ